MSEQTNKPNKKMKSKITYIVDDEDILSEEPIKKKKQKSTNNSEVKPTAKKTTSKKVAVKANANKTSQTKKKYSNLVIVDDEELAEIDASVKKKKSSKRSSNKTNKVTEDIANQPVPAVVTNNLKIDFNNKNKLIMKALKLSVFVVLAILVYYLFFYNHFYNLVVEVGNPAPKLKHFVKNENEIDDCQLVSDLSTIDINKEGTYPVVLQYKNRSYEVTLTYDDTTSPTCEFVNITRFIDYEFNPNDFVENVYDVQETKVTSNYQNEVLDFGHYLFMIRVEDVAGNYLERECSLTISPIVAQIDIEYGNKITYGDLFVSEDFYNLVSQERINEINQAEIGQYEITINYNNDEFKSIINIKDTQGPDLVVKDISSYHINKEIDVNSFVVSSYDSSGVKEVYIESEIKRELGKQEVVIVAKDIYDNITRQTCTLSFLEDKKGPVIKGLTTITLDKNQEFDFSKNVAGYDEEQQESTTVTCETTIRSFSEAGVFYVKYYSKDSLGNQSCYYRKVIINHDDTDTQKLLDEFIANNMQGLTVAQAAQKLKSLVSYSNTWGGSDPLWQALYYKTGNCYVHATLFEKILDYYGYENMMIHCNDNYHYWNLVKVDGVWRHYDATGTWPAGPMTDYDRRYLYNQHPWDKEAYPECN